MIATLVLFDAGYANADATFTKKQMAAIKVIIHDYIKSHSKNIVKTLDINKGYMDKYNNHNQVLKIEKNSTDLLNDKRSPIIGNVQGNQTIVEFFDYQCPYCLVVWPTLMKMLHRNQRLRIIIKDLPILGPISQYAARIGLIAAHQNRYMKYRVAMESVSMPLDIKKIDAAARVAGINMIRAKHELDQPWVGRELDRNLRLAESLDIQGTPAFVVGTTLINGATTSRTLDEAVAVSITKPR
jgi:protein-disulfide isomerase